jgi:hypothetical protein
MKPPVIFALVIPLFLTACPPDEVQTYDPRKDPDIAFINSRAVPRNCSRMAADINPQTHRVFTLPSFSFMSVKVDLGKMDLDPKQVQPVTESLIALSWGRADLCLNVKQRASGPSQDEYQKAWDSYIANTQKLSQFALIALTFRPAAVQTGPPKTPAAEANKTPKPATDQQSTTKGLVDALAKWLAAYGKTETTPAAKTKGARVAATGAPETGSREARLKMLSRELIQRPARHDSDVGL